MPPVAHHVVLGLSIAALAGVGLRVASLASPRGLERAVAAAVIAAAIAALEALVLGLVRLGTSTEALAAAAALTWLATRRLLPSPDTAPGSELTAEWRAASVLARVALGAVLGAGLAWAVWLLRHPALGIDTVGYHLTEIVAWVGNGSPGAVEPIFPSLPVGNYPLTNEVLLAWGTGIARSFVFVTLWAPAMMLLLATAAWAGLRSLRLPVGPAAISVAALCAVPVLTHYQQNGASTELPALAWLVSAAFLCHASVERPALLAPALVAAGLAVGTKTTTLPLALLVLVLAAIANRRELRRLARPLALAGATGLAVGGYWYLRNLVDHGWPLWPFMQTHWSDPMPVEIGPGRGVNASFLDRPGFTIERVGNRWLDLFAGGFLLIAAAVAVSVVARTRRIVAAAGVTLVSLLLWMNAPFTGASVREYEVATASIVRYLVPALLPALLTLALAATSTNRLVRTMGLIFLVTGLTVNVVQTADLGYPSVPSLRVPVLGAVLGAVAAALASRAAVHLPPLSAGRRALAGGLACAAIGAAIAPEASGYVARHAATARLYGTDTIQWFTTQPSFRQGNRTIWAAPITLAPLAGDRLQHEFRWISNGESCARVRATARRGWVIVLVLPQTGAPLSTSARCLAGQRPSHKGLGFTVYGG